MCVCLSICVCQCVRTLDLNPERRFPAKRRLSKRAEAGVTRTDPHRDERWEVRARPEREAGWGPDWGPTGAGGACGLTL